MVTIPGKSIMCRSGGIRPGQWRILLAVSASLALAPWFGISSARGATAGTYPDRPIHVVVPFAAGTQLDLAARIIGPKLADALIARLDREFAAIMGQPEVQDRFTQLGMESLATSPEEFSAEIREATGRWAAGRKGNGASAQVTAPPRTRSACVGALPQSYL
jgi:tripartite-type tricarboxylate transporter receptor subunit TctC